MGCKVAPPSNLAAIQRDKNIIPVSIPMFSGARISMVLSVTLPNETGSPKTQMAAEILLFNVSQLIYIRDSNKIPTATPCFQSRKTRRDYSMNTFRCMGYLKSKMAAINRK